MLAPSPRRRFALAIRGYAAVGLFCVALLALRLVATGLTSTETLILSAILASPLALALFWEHLKGLKVGELEVRLAEVSLPIDVELAAAVQDLKGSETQELVETISAAIGRSDLRLVQVNLRSTPYWWSTRMFLLAALADEYTHIERLVFVEQDAARIYVGMTTPRIVRRTLGRQFPDYEQAFQKLQAAVQAGNTPARTEVQNIGYQWPGVFPRPEAQIKLLVSTAQFHEWFGDSLLTESRDWDGSPATAKLYAKILTCTTDYVPLLNGKRLEKVVNRNELARRVAETALM